MQKLYVFNTQIFLSGSQILNSFLDENYFLKLTLPFF